MCTLNAGSNEAVPLSNVPGSMLPDQGSNFPAYPGNSSSDPSQIPGNMLPEPDINLPAYPGNTQPIIPNPDVNQRGSVFTAPPAGTQKSVF